MNYLHMSTDYISRNLPTKDERHFRGLYELQMLTGNVTLQFTKFAEINSFNA